MPNTIYNLGNGGHGDKRDVRGDRRMALDTSPGHTPVPVGELALAGSHQHDVIDLVFNAEGVLGGGFILRARIRAHVGVLQPHLCCQAVHGVKG